jgi:hypothetical protein
VRRGKVQIFFTDFYSGVLHSSRLTLV